MSCFYEGREDMSWCSKQDAQSHTHRAHPHTHSVEDKTLTSLVQWCWTGRVQPLDHEANALTEHAGCCERSEGEHHSHNTEPVQEQSGRRRRRCPRRSFEGNGFDVFTMSVQGMCLLLPKMSLHMVRTVGVVRLLWSLCLRLQCCYNDVVS